MITIEVRGYSYILVRSDFNTRVKVNYYFMPVNGFINYNRSAKYLNREWLISRIRAMYSILFKDKSTVKDKPLLQSRLATYFNYSNEEKAYLTDVLTRATFIEIGKIEHSVLELADGQRTIDEMVNIIYNKYPKNYQNKESLKKEIMKFFKKIEYNSIFWVD